MFSIYIIISKISFAGSQLLKIDKLLPLPLAPRNETIITVSLILCIIIFTLANVLYYRRLRQILKTSVNHHYMNQLVRDGNLLTETISILLYGIYLITLSILFYSINTLILKIHLFSTNATFEFLNILGLVIIFLLAKPLLIRFIGFIFKTKNETYNYLLLMFIFDHVTGLILLLFLIVITFLKLKLLLYFVIFLTGIILLYRIIRIGVNKISPPNFSVFYLILYICSVEILPLVIFIKLIYRHF